MHPDMHPLIIAAGLLSTATMDALFKEAGQLKRDLHRHVAAYLRDVPYESIKVGVFGYLYGIRKRVA